MTRVGKLTKLKSAIKRWPSIRKLGRSTSTVVNDGGENMSNELHAVYVGKSRRRYHVSADVIKHPLFQELVDKSATCGNDDVAAAGVVVSCEVVLFEHLLWMFQNSATQLGSTSELVEFYTC